MPDALTTVAAQNRRLQQVFAAVEQANRFQSWVEIGALPRSPDWPEGEQWLLDALDYLAAHGLLESHTAGGERFWRVRR